MVVHALGARIGLAGGTGLTTIDQVVADAAWAAEVGFDSYWVSFVAGVEPMVALAVAAGSVDDIELGTSVVPTVGRHPIALAQLSRTTQQACGGRFTLGIGPSHQIVAEGLYGEQWARPLQRTSEYLDALVPLCNGEPAAISGEQVTAHMTLDVPSEPVPVILAALGPKMLELAGRMTDGTHVGQTGPHTLANHTVPMIQAAAAKAGRPDPRIIALINVCVAETDAERRLVRQAAAPGAATYASLPSYRAMLDREGIDDATDLILVGSIDEIAAGLAAYVEAGATDLRIGVASPDDTFRTRTRDALAGLLSQ